ncbi:uncharacterized protein (TIGR02646 family) [Chitinophaga dinghuensis]|uniref:Uncharacterized protein (TIGR02646 family) n=1 Tax=Chitinophaga dinghuensis TaxID=1539050 RepID=A0A327VVN8_9BACT|nr:HNH endonuclease [Chitinophaga dinghuensis]RAJ79290.1 uncharacterized protein (TIGR02646 family) [Chitinophaga dinghuensis]
MPDIKNAYIYSKDFEDRLKAKFPKDNTNHLQWSDEDIADIRSDIREFYRQQQKGKCAYCMNDLSLSAAANCQVEHVVPKSSHPNFITESRNLCVACADCNGIKKDKPVTVKDNLARYPKTGNAFKIVHPHFDCFDDHIYEVNGYYLDITDKGAHTIQICKLNRKLHKLRYVDDETDFAEMTILSTAFLNEKDERKRKLIMKKMKKLLIFT